MTDAGPEERLHGIHSRIREINLLSRALGDVGIVFEDTTLGAPSRLHPPELGLLRCVSWAFMLLFEAGRVGVKYLVDYRRQGQHVDAKLLGERLALVSSLRTYFQHYLEMSSDHNVSVDGKCTEWFANVCGTAVPATDEHWGKCLMGFLLTLEEILDALVVATREIEAHPARSELVAGWASRKRRFRSPGEFDRVIEQVSNDMGRDEIDVIKFRKRYLERWQRTLETADDGADMPSLMRRVVEQALLAEVGAVLPISGRDVMERFSVAPGRQVGELLAHAKRLYAERPCAKDELMRRLVEYVQREKVEEVSENNQTA